MDHHYAKRFPSITYAFGIYENFILEGIVTFGTPSSAPLRSGVCGPEYAKCVLELNRLSLKNNKRNHASALVSRAIKQLPSGKIIVSYADTQQGHIGYVYQACNFLYCGMSARRTDWKIKGREEKHGQSIADEFRGKNNRADLMRQKYGDDFYLADRPLKHRYVFFVGSKKFKRNAFKSLRYEIKPYPKKPPTARPGE